MASWGQWLWGEYPWGGGPTSTMSADLELPCLEIEAEGTIYPVITADIVLPCLEIEAEVIVNPVMSADLELPALELSSEGYLDISGTADLILPVLELEATGFNGCSGTADLILPVFEVEAYGEVIPVTVTYYAIALNPVSQGLADYKNYAFNSFAYFNGKYLGANSAGIYELEGTKDAGEDIDAIVLSGDVDTYKGSESLPPVKKKIGEAWLSCETSGELRFILEGDKDGTIYYPLIKNERVKFARGLKSRFYKMGIKNINGAYFKLKNIRLKAEAISHRTR